jgi:hypothetical protein
MMPDFPRKPEVMMPDHPRTPDLPRSREPLATAVAEAMARPPPPAPGRSFELAPGRATNRKPYPNL